MAALARRDLHGALCLLRDVSAQACDTAALARAGVEALPRLVASEVTTLSVCDLASGKRTVIGNPVGSISREDLASFDRHFHEHPLVVYHSSHPDGPSRRISDLMPSRDFRATGVYNDYYRRIGIHSAIAVPLYVDRSLLVSFVLNRVRADFSDRDRELLDLLRAPLAGLYRGALALQRARLAAAPPESGLAIAGFAPLTPREREVLSWAAAGKTNRQIAEILQASPRTVQKHLEHVFDKLGVETRTAAVMRWHDLALARGGPIQ